MNYLLSVDLLMFRASTDIHLNNFLSEGIYKFSNGLFLEMVKDFGLMRREYLFCFKIRYKEDELGLFWAKSLDLSFEPGFNIMVRIENKVFYVSTLGFILKLIVEALGLRKTMIHTLHICYDTDLDIQNRFKTLFLNKTAVKFMNRGKMFVNGTGPDDPYTIIGSPRGKEKHFVIYNKTNEIQDSGKEYIRNIHREKFGFKTIYRLELKLESRFKDKKKIDLMRLANNDYLETIFNTYYDILIRFEDLKTKEKIEFITLNNTGKIERVKKQKCQGEGGKQVKAMINFMDRECKSSGFTGVRKDWKLVRSALLKKHKLEAWYLMKK